LPINHLTVPTQHGWASREFPTKTDPWALCRSEFDIATLTVKRVLSRTYALFHRHWGHNTDFPLIGRRGKGRGHEKIAI